MCVPACSVRSKLVNSRLLVPRLHNWRFSTKTHFQGTTEYETEALILEAIRRPSDLSVKTRDDVDEQFHNVSRHYLSTPGKLFRPSLVCSMALTCNSVKHSSPSISDCQLKVAHISELIHTASLVHDDIVDNSQTRRSHSSVGAQYGELPATFSGNYIMSQASIALARLRNPEVIRLLSQVVEDLIAGEFMQLGSRQSTDERIAHYLSKTYKKTASLMANSCKAVSVLSSDDTKAHEAAFHVGRNIGLAFQLADDLQDFIISPEDMGKPTNADLKLGLATAPVLFAADQNSELEALIMRRFGRTGDVQKARDIVINSSGLRETRLLIEKYLEATTNSLRYFPESSSSTLICALGKQILHKISSVK